MHDYYQILDLPRGATKEQIKKAYRRKVKECHPDRNASEEAHTLFIKVTEAYESLMGTAPGKGRQPRANGQPPNPRQTDHYEFYERVYSQAAEERRRAAKERVDRQTERQFEHYRRSNEAFRRSWPYKLLQGLGYLVRLSVLLLGVGGVLLAWIVYREGNGIFNWLVSVPILVISMVVVYFSAQYYWKSFQKRKPDK